MDLKHVQKLQLAVGPLSIPAPKNAGVTKSLINRQISFNTGLLTFDPPPIVIQGDDAREAQPV
jgi:hypothetical protein